MEQIVVRINDLPADVGIVFVDKNHRQPDRYWNDVEIDKLCKHIAMKIAGKKNVDLFVVGRLPVLLPAKITAFCKDNGVKGFAFCLPGQLENRVYLDDGNKSPPDLRNISISLN